MEIKRLSVLEKLINLSDIICEYRDSNPRVNTFPHVHDFYEFTYVQKGTLLVSVNGKLLTLKEHSLFLIRPHEIHSRILKDSGLYINVVFTIQTMDQLLVYLNIDKLTNIVKKSNSLPIIDLQEREIEFLNGKFTNLNNSDDEDYRKFQIRNILSEMLMIYLAINMKNDKHNAKIPHWLTEVIRGLQEKNNLVNGLDYIFSKSDKSQEYVCRSFQKYFNCTPTQYVNIMRMENAVNLLISTDIKIDEICFSVGFKSISMFYRMFKKINGITPAVMRRDFNYYKQKSDLIRSIKIQNY